MVFGESAWGDGSEGLRSPGWLPFPSPSLRVGDCQCLGPRRPLQTEAPITSRATLITAELSISPLVCLPHLWDWADEGVSHLFSHSAQLLEGTPLRSVDTLGGGGPDLPALTWAGLHLAPVTRTPSADINECTSLSEPCRSGFNCINTVGSYTRRRSLVICGRGYHACMVTDRGVGEALTAPPPASALLGPPGHGGSCRGESLGLSVPHWPPLADVNECETGVHRVRRPDVPQSLPGSYRCDCKPGFQRGRLRPRLSASAGGGAGGWDAPPAVPGLPQAPASLALDRLPGPSLGVVSAQLRLPHGSCCPQAFLLFACVCPYLHLPTAPRCFLL